MLCKTIILDCDGVLTDGKVHYTENGERSKSFHSRDITAITRLTEAGYQVIILTQSTWKGIKHFAERCDAKVFTGITDKAQWLERKMPAIKYDFIAVCDDIGDIGLMDRSLREFCPCDAIEEIRTRESIHILKTASGNGCIAELAQILLK